MWMKSHCHLSLETHLTEQQWPRAEQHNHNRTFNLMSYADFKAQYSSIDWDAFLGATSVEGLEYVNVSHPKLVEAAIEIINSMSLDDWKAVT